MKHTGGCHCGKVRFEVETDIKKVMECNCSHCHKKGFLMHFADKAGFTLLSGKENLSEYHFNKGAIHHKFCRDCGVESFSDSDAFPQMMINARCIDELDTDALPKEKFNGKDY